MKRLVDGLTIVLAVSGVFIWGVDIGAWMNKHNWPLVLP